MKKKIYILNVAFCKFSITTKQQEMYAPFLGDMNTVDSFIKKISKLDKYAVGTDFSNLTSLYLTYYSDGGSEIQRNNKKVICDLITKYADTIASDSDEKYFVLLIHAHGGQQTQDSLYNIKVDSFCAVKDDERLSGPEILTLINPIVSKCDSYVILNTCYSDAAGVLNLTKSIKDLKKDVVPFAEVNELNDLTSNFFLKIIGMSSELVKANNYMENTYCIRVLKSILEMGIDLSDSEVFELLTKALSLSDLKNVYPNYIIVQKSKNNPPPDINLKLQDINTNKDAENFFKAAM